MADEAIQYHHLSKRHDGCWSELSRYLREHFGTDRLNLNEAWALTPSAWTCPACKRVKVEIARKTRDGVVLCQLERHHDHLGDLAMKILREKAYRNVPDDNGFNAEPY